MNLTTLAGLEEAINKLPSVEQLMGDRQERGIDPNRAFCQWYLQCELARFAYIRKHLEMIAEQQAIAERYRPELQALDNAHIKLLHNAPPLWERKIPTENGHYWAYSEQDHDMLEVWVEVKDYGTVISNAAKQTLGLVGKPPGITAEQFAIVFTHFSPYTLNKPERPA